MKRTKMEFDRHFTVFESHIVPRPPPLDIRWIVHSLLLIAHFRVALKCLYSQQGFCSFGISVMCKKVCQAKKTRLRHFNALKSGFKVLL